MHYKKLSAFYRTLLEVIVAIIIGQSFFQADAIFIPMSKIWTTPIGAIDAAGMLMAYFIVISGWIGYYRSVSKEPHKGRAGNARFILDLTIVFFTYYIVSVANPNSEAHFNEIFLWVLPALFVFYLLWDVTKFIEYKNDVNNRSIRWRRMLTTVAFAGFFITQSAVYGAQLQSIGIPYPYPTEPPWNKTYFDHLYIISSMFMVGVYRALKWDDRKMPPSLKTNKTK